MGTIKLTGLSPEELPLPGETLAETLADFNMSEEQLAIATQFSVEFIRNVIVGKQSILESFAQELQKVFGARAAFWTGLQKAYDEDLAWLIEHAAQHDEDSIVLRCDDVTWKDAIRDLSHSLHMNVETTIYESDKSAECKISLPSSRPTVGDGTPNCEVLAA